VVSQLVYTLGGSGFAGANGSMMIEVVVSWSSLSIPRFIFWIVNVWRLIGLCLRIFFNSLSSIFWRRASPMRLEKISLRRSLPLPWWRIRWVLSLQVS
jgi:cellulose synthase/poly-beta-1,6-N-acetylglucosamine synthase-like glycosyltransferase